MDDQKSPYMTAAEVAAHLRIKIGTIYSWSATGKIPAVKINGVIRFSRLDIEAWVQSCVRPPSPPIGHGRLRPSGGSRSDISRIVDQARREVLLSALGEARPVKPGKEGIDGAV